VEFFSMLIRLAIPTSLADYTSIAKLHNLARLDPVSPQELYNAEMQSPHESYFRRKVAMNAENTIVGTSLVRPHWERCFLSVSTHPDYRRQGIGSALYEDALAYARQQDAASLITILLDTAAEGRSFAEQRGFNLHQHWRYFQLDLTAFDQRRFAEIIPALHKRGIRFFSLADVGNIPENQRKLYELNRRTSLDAPGEDSFPSFEEFARDIYNADWFRPDGQIVAADGEQWVGLGAVGLDADNPQVAFNAFTGIDRTHRRQHIALALTLLTIDYAQRHGATTLRVFNDSRNEGMLAMQEKLGYQPVAGRYVMTRQLSS
jgi:GNAT superfamily N-acetyltransferase